MDPITGLSLAASVIAVVEFGIKAALNGREIYEHGCTSENADVEYYSNKLATITKALRPSADTSAPATQLSEEEHRLIEIAANAQATAEELLFELKSSGSQRPSQASAASKTVKALWRKRTLDKLREKLENYRRILQTSLLSSLR